MSADAARPNVRPIYDAINGAMTAELDKWTVDVPDELRMALARAATKRLQLAGMLNFDRPWEQMDDPDAHGTGTEP